MANLANKNHTLPEALAYRAQHTPDAPIYLFLDSNNKEVPVTYAGFDRAALRAAAVLSNGSKPDDTVAVIGTVDTVVHQTVVLGLMCAQLVPFPISPRLPPVAVLHLLRSTDCHRLLISRSALPDLVKGIGEQLKAADPNYELSIEDFPLLHNLYPDLGVLSDASPVERLVPVEGSFIGGVYLHSSGSTGLPKPIRLSNRILTSHAQFPAARDFIKGSDGSVRVGAMSLPAFHLMGFVFQCLWSIMHGHCMVLYAPTGGIPVAPNPNNILDLAIKTRVNNIILVPSFLKIWSSQPENMKKLAQIPLVIFGGGPLTDAAGDALVKAGVNLRSAYGGTEFGVPVRTLRQSASREEWQWLEFSERADVRWDDQGDGTYEAAFMTCPTHVLAIENLLDCKGYATKDLFRMHPTKEGLWRIVGRKDDVLIHSNGEKTVPGPMQDVMMHDPLIKGALMFGRDRDRPGVLIEVVAEAHIDMSDDKQVAGLRNKIWPVVQNANSVAPAFSKVYKEMILIASASKPLDYGIKGIVTRKSALEKYKDEIEAIYNTVDSNATASVPPPKDWSGANTRQWLLTQVQDILGGETKINPDVDLFEQGLDSLSATLFRLRLSGALKRTVHPSASKINEGTIYSHPTIDALAALVSGEEETSVTVEDMIEKYSQGLEQPIPRNEPLSEKPVVLLTGSTGNLGAELLLRLLEDPAVERVYALNRRASGTSSKRRHEDRFLDRGFDTSLLSSDKIVYLEGDSTQVQLGLSNEVYETLKASVTTIIHNAWRLDFNLSLSSFETHIRGTRNLIDLARAGKYGSNVRFIFTSSVASAQSWDPVLGRYPEEHVADVTYARGSGYGESKYAAERILKDSGLSGTSIRIGQVAGGAPNGAWALSDWVPIIVKSSMALGILPNMDSLLYWIAMDAVADAVLDFIRAEQQRFAVNVTSSKPATWTDIFTYIGDALVQHGKPRLELVPFKTWLATVKEQPQSKAVTIPALKLVEFLDAISQGRGETELDTSHAERISTTMASQEPLSREDVERWVNYWLDKGM